MNQFVVSIILLNVLIAIVSKAYDTSMSKGRSHFLSVRLNIAALYGSMGLTSENKLNIMLHKGRKRVQNSIKRNYPDLWDLFATKRRHQARTPTFRPDEGDDGDSDDEEAARKTRQEIKTVLSNMSSLQSGFRKSQERTSQETVSSLDLLKEEMMALREEVRALREGGDARVDPADRHERVHGRVVVLGDVAADEVIALRDADSAEAVGELGVGLDLLREDVDAAVHVHEKAVDRIRDQVAARGDADRIDAHFGARGLGDRLHAAVEAAVAHPVSGDHRQLTGVRRKREETSFLPPERGGCREDRLQQSSIFKF